MKSRRHFLLQGGAAAGALALLPWRALRAAPHGAPATAEVSHTDDEWRKLLSAQQFAVLRRNGTERASSSALNTEHRSGRFACAGCRLELFSSSRKFDSGTGWPSFWEPLEHAVTASTDSMFGMLRTAVSCRRCAGHLGHVFDDGPKPTGLRYCINGVAMTFTPGAA